MSDLLDGAGLNEQAIDFAEIKLGGILAMKIDGEVKAEIDGLE